jgi:hypothetical protein
MQPTNHPMGSHGEVGDLARPQETSHMDGIDLATAKNQTDPETRHPPTRVFTRRGRNIAATLGFRIGCSHQSNASQEELGGTGLEQEF